MQSFPASAAEKEWFEQVGLDGACDLLRPLTKRQRPLEIADQLRSLSRLPRGVVLQRARDGGLARETLVSLARTYSLQNDTDAVHAVLEALVSRVSGSLRGKLQGWNIRRADQEDLQRHVLAGLYGFWLETDAAEELWECNFTTPFKLRTQTLIESFLKKNPTLLSAWTAEDGSDGESERQVEDPEAAAAVASLVEYAPLHTALRELAHTQVSWSRAFHDRYVAGFTEEEIAGRYGVSSRTIRNWITAARRFLQSRIEGEDGQDV